MALHRRFRPVFKKYAPRGTARFAKPLQGPFSLGAEMHLFSLFSASKSPEKWLYDAICRKKQLFAGSFGSRSHSSCSFTVVKPADFRIEFAYNLCVWHIDELSSVGRLPYLFSVRALFDIHRSVFQQLIEPLFMGEIQLDLSVPVTFEISIFITGVILAS